MGCWVIKELKETEETLSREELEEEGLGFARMSIPGLSRYYIGKLAGAGYGDEECLKEVSEGELGKVLPKRLVDRIQKRSCAENCKPTTVLEIDQHRPDRIIFEGKKLKLI